MAHQSPPPSSQTFTGAIQRAERFLCLFGKQPSGTWAENWAKTKNVRERLGAKDQLLLNGSGKSALKRALAAWRQHFSPARSSINRQSTRSTQKMGKFVQCSWMWNAGGSGSPCATTLSMDTAPSTPNSPEVHLLRSHVHLGSAR